MQDGLQHPSCQDLKSIRPGALQSARSHHLYACVSVGKLAIQPDALTRTGVFSTPGESPTTIDPRSDTDERYWVHGANTFDINQTLEANE